MLAGAARTHPERLAFTYLGDGVTEERRVTYAELDGRARAIAQRLTKDGISGERALLLYPPGLDFIEALFGCAYAGVTAVPAYPPNPARLARTLPRLLSIIGDSTPKAIVTTSAIEAIAPSVFAIAPELEAKCWIATDGIDIASGAGWSAPDITDASLILLQYTSGSTGTPKGVMLTHANLMHNQGLILESFGSDENMVGVGWLPLYHDMGLIGNVLHTLYMNAQCVLMSPMHFLQSPTAWLKAISKYRGTTAGGPNFAYEMCIRKVSAEVIDTLDLRSWRVAFNGAEPVRSDTLERFASTFGRCGFRREALLPCYGLAESSLIVSGKSRLYATCSVDERALGGGTVVH
ncbi:MAG: AMP-binding protein, partial [Polyangiaceae bacterium]